MKHGMVSLCRVESHERADSASGQRDPQKFRFHRIPEIIDEKYADLERVRLVSGEFQGSHLQ